MGAFTAFLGDRAVELVGVEAAGEGLDSGRHAASLSRGRPGIFHGSRSYLLQDADGQVQPAHSVSAGLDYPGVGPEHAFLKDSGPYCMRRYGSSGPGVHLRPSLVRGIAPRWKSHAVAWVLRRAALTSGDIVLINLSGRGDKESPWSPS
jgi:tryptophan synthase beta chain